MNSNRRRLSYNVPLELTALIRQIAEQDGIEPAYWLRKTLEKAVRERLDNDTKPA